MSFAVIVIITAIVDNRVHRRRRGRAKGERMEEWKQRGYWLLIFSLYSLYTTKLESHNNNGAAESGAEQWKLIWPSVRTI